MKIIVYSDSHGCRTKVRHMLEKEKDADFCFFLGDGLTEAQDMAEMYPHIKHIMVKGNCDYYSQLDTVAYKYIDGLTFVACHGHEYNVQGGLDALVSEAKAHGCQIALYGHTHMYRTEHTDGVYVMNPGAVDSPRGKNKPSYGVINIIEGSKPTMNIIAIK